jgi:Protein of unknown function (DUF3179)
MMPFDSYRELYPQGKVYSLNELGMFSWIWTGPAMPKLVDLFEKGKPVYDTLPLDDQRLPQQEKVYGISFDGESVAYTKDYLIQNKLISRKIGESEVVIVYFEEFDTVGLFDRNINGEVCSIDDLSQIDAYGNIKDGTLKRLDMYNGVFWMTWSFFYPETELLI